MFVTSQFFFLVIPSTRLGTVGVLLAVGEQFLVRHFLLSVQVSRSTRPG